MLEENSEAPYRQIYAHVNTDSEKNPIIVLYILPVSTMFSLC